MNFPLNFFPKFIKFENEVWLVERKWEGVKSREENLMQGLNIFLSIHHHELSISPS